MSFLSKIFGNKDIKSLKVAKGYLAQINSLEEDFSKLSDEGLKQKTSDLIRSYEQESNLEALIPEAFAAVRESSKRNIGLRHYDCQIVGGIILHNGSIAEMATGEGKTLAATLPCYLNALTKKSVLVITANEYLAERDAKWMGPIFEGLGMSVGFISSELNLAERKVIYEKDGYCSTCHQSDGKGIKSGGYPPLVDTKWVLGDPERLIKITLNGVMGRMEVRGKIYQGKVPMTAFGSLLTDREIAGVLTYIRNSFGNRSAVILPDQVKQVREDTKDKIGYYLANEL